MVQNLRIALEKRNCFCIKKRFNKRKLHKRNMIERFLKPNAEIVFSKLFLSIQPTAGVSSFFNARTTSENVVFTGGRTANKHWFIFPLLIKNHSKYMRI